MRCQIGTSNRIAKTFGSLSDGKLLRFLDNKGDGVPFQQSLFPEKERFYLLSESLKYLYGNDYEFLKNINNELVDSPWDELSRLHGLMLWLAYDCGADLRDEKEFNESPEDKQKRIRNKSFLFLVMPEAVIDQISFDEAKTSIEKTTSKFKRSYSKQWCAFHHLQGGKLYKLRKRAHIVHHRIKNRLFVGQLAFERNKANPTFHVVLRTGELVALTDICSEKGQRLYPKDNVAGINFP